jgi:hypothetical protein
VRGRAENLAGSSVDGKGTGDVQQLIELLGVERDVEQADLPPVLAAVGAKGGTSGGDVAAVSTIFGDNSCPILGVGVVGGGPAGEVVMYTSSGVAPP